MLSLEAVLWARYFVVWATKRYKALGFEYVQAFS